MGTEGFRWFWIRLQSKQNRKRCASWNHTMCSRASIVENCRANVVFHYFVFKKASKPRGCLAKKRVTMCGTDWILVACVMLNTRKASGRCQVRNALWCITSPPLVIKLPPLGRHFIVFGQKFTVHLPLIYPFGASSITLLDPPFPTGILIETFLVFKVEKWMPDQELTFGWSRQMTSACK